MSSANALRWDGGPGHYEVWYVTLTDPESGIGVWIRHTLLAPLDAPAEAALWLVAMAPDGDRFARLRLEPKESEQQRVYGESNCASLTSGHKFDLTEHPINV